MEVSIAHKRGKKSLKYRLQKNGNQCIAMLAKIIRRKSTIQRLLKRQSECLSLCEKNYLNEKELTFTTSFCISILCWG